MLYFTVLPLWLFSYIQPFFVHTMHPFHVSVCSIYYSEEEKSLQITHKLFADDFENTLNNPTNRQSDEGYVDVLNPTDRQLLNETIEDYLREHFTVTLNEKEQPMQYLGYEQEGIAIWCYMEITGVESIESCKINYTVLLEQFNDQVNLVHFNYKGDIKSMRLDHNQKSEQVTFD